MRFLCIGERRGTTHASAGTWMFGWCYSVASSHACVAFVGGQSSGPPAAIFQLVLGRHPVSSNSIRVRRRRGVRESLGWHANVKTRTPALSIYALCFVLVRMSGIQTLRGRFRSTFASICMHPWALRVDRPPLSPTLWREVREAGLCILVNCYVVGIQCHGSETDL